MMTNNNSFRESGFQIVKTEKGIPTAAARQLHNLLHSRISGAQLMEVFAIFDFAE
jgi:hypothetical protein